MSDWKSKRVLVIGAARQGFALARYLTAQGASVVLTDRRQAEDIPDVIQALSDLDIEWALGDHPINLLDGCDMACPSGGVPLTIPILLEAKARKIPLSNDSQIFLEAAPCTVIGITGSAGKSTVTTLVGRMVEQSLGISRTWVGGNIGNPLLSNLEEMEPDHIAVMELSSFQLEIMDVSPQIAGVLNLTPNHLDRHITMEAYKNAKANILRYQSPGDTAVIGMDDHGASEFLDFGQGCRFGFGLSPGQMRYPGVYLSGHMISFWDGNSFSDIMPLDDIELKGEHNQINVLAACALTRAANIPFEAMVEGVIGFAGVEHRLERVRIWKGIEWINDSVATAPERTMAAIRSFDEPLVLLAGGRDKNLPWDSFADLVSQRVDHLIVFGEAKGIISDAVAHRNHGNRPFSLDVCDDLKSALITAKEVVEPGDVVLLSPGCTSFDEFDDFAERGEWFRQWVKKLPQVN